MALSQRFAAVLDGSGSVLDLPVAALAGLSVGFAAFAAPEDLLASLAASAGLGEPIALAGLGPRLAIGTIGATAVFVIVYVLLRWLDRLGSHAGEGETARRPRLRRRDAHPDAPPPTPLFAARELAEPDFAPIQPAPRPGLPAWLPVGIANGTPPAPLEDLVARLEHGLGVRRAPPEAPTRQADPAPRVAPEAGGDRLQSAIESLQRLTASR